MSKVWSISPRLSDHLMSVLGKDGTLKPNKNQCVAIVRSTDDENPNEKDWGGRIPPDYGIFVIDKTELNKFHQIEDKKFGLLAFAPRKKDADALNKIIDINDNRIYIY